MQFEAARSMVWEALRHSILEAADIAKITPLSKPMVDAVLRAFERDGLIHPVQAGDTVHWTIGPMEDPGFDLHAYILDALAAGAHTPENLVAHAPVHVELVSVAKELTQGLLEGIVRPAHTPGGLGFKLRAT